MKEGRYYKIVKLYDVTLDCDYTRRYQFEIVDKKTEKVVIQRSCTENQIIELFNELERTAWWEVPMRRFRYHEPDEDGNTVDVTVTEAYILRYFWPYWKQKASEHNAYNATSNIEVSLENCIQDFLVITWAEELR